MPLPVPRPLTLWRPQAPKKAPTATPRMPPVFAASARRTTKSATKSARVPEEEAEGNMAGLIALLGLALALGLRGALTVEPARMSSQQASGPAEVDLKALVGGTAAACLSMCEMRGA